MALLGAATGAHRRRSDASTAALALTKPTDDHDHPPRPHPRPKRQSSVSVGRIRCRARWLGCSRRVMLGDIPAAMYKPSRSAKASATERPRRSAYAACLFCIPSRSPGFRATSTRLALSDALANSQLASWSPRGLGRRRWRCCIWCGAVTPTTGSRAPRLPLPDKLGHAILTQDVFGDQARVTIQCSPRPICRRETAVSSPAPWSGHGPKAASLRRASRPPARGRLGLSGSETDHPARAWRRTDRSARRSQRSDRPRVCRVGARSSSVRVTRP